MFQFTGFTQAYEPGITGDQAAWTKFEFGLLCIETSQTVVPDRREITKSSAVEIMPWGNYHADGGGVSDRIDLSVYDFDYPNCPITVEVKRTRQVTAWTYAWTDDKLIVV